MYHQQILLFCLFGLLLGSFFNVVGLRLPLNQTFINGRSRCPSCKQTLSWYELVPVLSFLLQTGKCVHCKTRISWMYPFIELATAFLFTYSFVRIGIHLELMISLLLISMLMIIFVTDLTFMLIPNKLLLFFLPILVILRIIVPLDPWWSAPLGMFVGFSLILVIIFMSRGGMGTGDMKLFAILGVVLGVDKVLITFFLACVIGSVIGMALLLLKRVKRKQAVPFGPYIMIASLLAYFYGDQLINWYARLF